MITTLIGRGHSGTRAYSNLLKESGMYMGPTLSRSSCYSPYNARYMWTGARFTKLFPVGEGRMYEACRLFGQRVKQVGEFEWDFSEAVNAEIPDRFKRLVDAYLDPIYKAEAEGKPAGWKLPETVLMLPWLARHRPDIKFVHWVRDPRDVILHRHLTDDLNDFGIPYKYGALKWSWLWSNEDKLTRRAISWKYQHDLVEATPTPENWLVVRFEDFVLDPDPIVKRISDFLGVQLDPIKTKKEAVGRWRKRQDEIPDVNFLRPLMDTYGYSYA